MSDLPAGWEWTTIGEVGDVQLGRQRSPKNHSGPHMRPYLRSANVTWTGIDLTDVKEMNFEPTEAATFALKPGDLLLNEASGSPNEVGKPAIWRGGLDGCCFQNTLVRVRSKGPATDYLYWYCRSAALAGDFGRAGRGVNIRHLGKQGLASFPLPLPPMVEQERLVVAIEEHLSRLDAAEAALRSGLARLARFEDLVYSQALVLTVPRTRLGDVVRTTSGGTPKRTRPDLFGGLIPWIKSGELGDGTVRQTEETITEQALKESSAKLVPEGTVLVAMYGATIGKLGRVGVPVAATNQAVAAMFPSEHLDSGYLWNVLRALRSDLVRLGKGGAQPNISQSIIRELEIPVPTLAEQRAANANVERSISVFRAACDVSRAAVRRSAALRRSILAAAFSGQLVAQNPDDEPASVLLERIRNQGAAALPSRRTRTGQSRSEALGGSRSACEDEASDEQGMRP